MQNLHLQILEEFYQNSQKVFEKLSMHDLKNIISVIQNSNNVFVLGVGHSGMFGRILAMKLNHIGINAYSVFNEINPSFTPKDLFIGISQSGTTKTIVALAEKAKNLNGKVVGITTNINSNLAELADITLNIKEIASNTKLEVLSILGNEEYPQNIYGALFGFNIFILIYTIIPMLAQERNETVQSINHRHANLQ